MWPSLCLTILAGWSCLSPDVVSAQTGNKLYVKVGDQVVLKPGIPLTSPINKIVWRDDNNLAIQWDPEDNVTFYRHFKGNAALNISNGEMTITGLTQDYNAVYTPEINDKKGTPIDLRKDSLGIAEFSCELSNPVSQETSKPLANPFTKQGMNISMGLTVLISLVAAVIVLALVHRCKAGEWFFNKESLPYEADFWRKEQRQGRNAAESNGIKGHQEQGHEDAYLALAGTLSSLKSAAEDDVSQIRCGFTRLRLSGEEPDGQNEGKKGRHCLVWAASTTNNPGFVQDFITDRLLSNGS
ncbi:hypothetical protein INR49_000806, partial [Caranx melampygus]